MYRYFCTGTVYMTRRTKLGYTPGSLSVGTPPQYADRFWNHLLNCLLNRFQNFGCFGKMRVSAVGFSGFLVVSTSALLIFKSICAKWMDLLVWLEDWEVDFPTSDDFRLYSILKKRVRRVFYAIKLRWGVSATPSTNHELKRSWAKNRFWTSSFCLCHYQARRWTAWPRMIFVCTPCLREESGAFFSYQAPESGTGNPLNEPRFEEIMNQKSDVQNWTPDLWLTTSSVHGS